MTALLEVRGLRILYGPITAVEEVSLNVPAGQTVALLGANGAGKSSTLRAIAGLRRPQAGEVLFGGERVERLGTAELVRRGLAAVPDSKDLFPHFTVAENLRMGGHLRAAAERAAQRDRVLDLFPGLARRLHAPAWQLSGGEQQMLALGRALMAQPRLLLLDEPSLGLAPQVVETIFRALQEIVGGGTSLLLAEQSTAAALSLASYAYVLRLGRVALEGSGQELRHNPRVVDLYLGEAGTTPRP